MRISDWSSDVCSSDLAVAGQRAARQLFRMPRMIEHAQPVDLQRIDVGRRTARQVHAETLPGHGVAILEPGIADRLFADPGPLREQLRGERRSEEHTSELQSLMRISYAVFCLKQKRQHTTP